MKFIFLILLLSSSVWASPRDVLAHFSCKLAKPVDEQGMERFIEVYFFADQTAQVTMANLESPVRILNEQMKTDSANYSDQATFVMGRWSLGGEPALYVALNYFEKFWGASLHFVKAYSSAEFSYAAGDELELFCKLKN